ncbi:MAG: hypothetical protein ACI4MG_06580 [Aristaeellaceae bacterium]
MTLMTQYIFSYKSKMKNKHRNSVNSVNSGGHAGSIPGCSGKIPNPIDRGREK